jgi:transcriptional regulator with XRE-family HTH domain
MLMQTFGTTIKELRADAGYSLRAFAGVLRVSPSWLSKVERGVEVPGADVIRRMAAHLGADTDELMALAGKVPGDLLSIIQRHPKQARRVLEKLDKAA